MQGRERFIKIGGTGLYIVLLVVMYATLSILLRPYLGNAVAILEIIPTYIIGWRKGMWPAILAGILCGILDMGILSPLAGVSTTYILSKGGALGVVAIVASGAIIGRLHDLSAKLHQELAQRKEAQTELVQAQSDLERKVEERTAALCQSEERFRIFLSDVLELATDGRLHVCNVPEQLPAPFPFSAPPVALHPQALAELRNTLRKVGDELNFPSDRFYDLLLGVGEAAMNAVVHGDGGEAIIRWQHPDGQGASPTIQVFVKDFGTGISVSELHHATLKDGYTTKGSLGHGFGIMLRLVDHVWLLTGPEGTTVVLQQSRTALAETPFSHIAPL